MKLVTVLCHYCGHRFKDLDDGTCGFECPSCGAKYSGATK